MTLRRKFFVGEVVDCVIKRNSHYYTEEMAYLLADLIDTAFTAKSSFRLSEQIDELRFKKQEELAAMLNNPSDLASVINSPLNSLPKEQEEKRREIKFLFNVAATLLHW